MLHMYHFRAIVGCISKLMIQNKEFPFYMAEHSKDVHLGNCKHNVSIVYFTNIYEFTTYNFLFIVLQSCDIVSFMSCSLIHFKFLIFYSGMVQVCEICRQK